MRAHLGKVCALLLGPALLSASLVALPTQAKAAPAPVTASRASLSTADSRTNRRLDALKTPKLRWYRCYGSAECTTVKVPRDYDRPKGAKVELALLRRKARNPQRRIGSLFVNPGGPSGSAVQFAYFAPLLFPGLLDRFDVVGMDPRGTNFSDSVSCFKSHRQQAPVVNALGSLPFPYTKAEEARFVRANKKLGRACSSRGKPMSASMSTAQVARDMELMRRAVGDRRLSYLGMSYGSYLGQVYASLFPNRFRALAIDGVLDPVAWAGRSATKNQPTTDRIRSAAGSLKALREILVRCDRAGEERCAFAAGNPVANYDLIAERLKRRPVVLADPLTGERLVLRYADFVAFTLATLYAADGWAYLTEALAELMVLTAPPSARQVSVVERRAAGVVFARVRADFEEKHQATPLPQGHGFDFPYESSLEAFSAVLCTDSVNPRDASYWPVRAARADRRVPYFGRYWIWTSAACASKTWTAKDEDAYRGTFRRRTASPLLVVGNLWDPSTNYSGAVKAASLFPNSRLLSSDSWGHTAYGSSACVTNAVNAYLVSRRLPAAGTRCVGDSQPFVGEPAEPTDVSRYVQAAVPDLLRGARWPLDFLAEHVGFVTRLSR